MIEIGMQPIRISEVLREDFLVALEMSRNTKNSILSL